MSTNYQLITPPSSVELSEDKSSISKSAPASPGVVDKELNLKEYIRNTSILITSMWKNPIDDHVSTLNSSIIKPVEFQVYLKEILKRSRCSLTILQIASFYLFKLQKNIRSRTLNSKHLNCPKKVFLICLILAFKYSLDSNYKFSTWSKMSGLSIKSLQTLEIKILMDLNYELNDVNKPGVFTAWVKYLNISIESEQGHDQLEPLHGKRSITEDYSASTKRIRVN